MHEYNSNAVVLISGLMEACGSSGSVMGSCQLRSFVLLELYNAALRNLLCLKKLLSIIALRLAEFNTQIRIEGFVNVY